MNIRWPDNTLPVEIYCAPGVLTGLEVMAADGLLALPRIGLGIGGLLVGKRLNDGVEIARYVAIDCSHALGPAFVLTADEVTAGLSAVGSDSEVVGWYCSKTQGQMDLTEHDLSLFHRFCPERGQVVLLIRPSKGKVTAAAFGTRQENGGVTGVLMGAPRDLAWQELAAFQVAATPPIVAQPVVEKPAGASPNVSPIAKSPPEIPVEIPVTMPRSGTLFGVPDGFGLPDGPRPDRKPRRWPIRLLIVVVLLAILAAAAFFTREYWMAPKPAIALVASSDWRGLVSVIWNGEALSEQDRAVLVIDDGSGPLHTVQLSSSGMRVGSYQLDCRPGRVTVTLLSGDLSDTIMLTARTETYLPESGISK